MTDKGELIHIARQSNDLFISALSRQRRTLKFMAGEPYEPVAHEAEAVLVGVLGGGAA